MQGFVFKFMPGRPRRLTPRPRMPRPALQVEIPRAQAGMAGARPHGRIQHARFALEASPRPSLVLAGALQSGKSMFPRLIPAGEGRFII